MHFQNGWKQIGTKFICILLNMGQLSLKKVLLFKETKLITNNNSTDVQMNKLEILSSI